MIFPRGKRPEFRRMRDLYEPLLTATAQVLPFLNQSVFFSGTGDGDKLLDPAHPGRKRQKLPPEFQTKRFTFTMFSAVS